jgi:DNA-binding NarL/FixJ family response regulator
MTLALASPTPLLTEPELSALMQREPPPQARRPAPIEIMFADPHPVVIDGLNHTFANHPDFVVKNCVRDGATAWREILKFQPDIVVMELTLGEKDSLSLIRDLKNARLRTLPVIFTHANLLGALEAMAEGVNGLVSKRKPKEVLMECIREVHHGQQWLDDDFSIFGLSRNDVPLAPPFFKRHLTLRELSVVQLLIRGQSNREIARTFSMAEGTVKAHLKHIYQKLQCDNRVGLLSRMRLDSN